jgi:hypothetical protein
MHLARLHAPVSACMQLLSARTCCFNHPSDGADLAPVAASQLRTISIYQTPSTRLSSAPLWSAQQMQPLADHAAHLQSLHMHDAGRNSSPAARIPTTIIHVALYSTSDVHISCSITLHQARYLALPRAPLHPCRCISFVMLPHGMPPAARIFAKTCFWQQAHCMEQ